MDEFRKEWHRLESLYLQGAMTDRDFKAAMRDLQDREDEYLSWKR